MSVVVLIVTKFPAVIASPIFQLSGRPEAYSVMAETVVVVDDVVEVVVETEVEDVVEREVEGVDVVEVVGIVDALFIPLVVQLPAKPYVLSVGHEDPLFADAQ